MTDDWIPDLGLATGAKYRAIADALGAAIQSGALPSGARLPAQRDLAATLGVDLTTVTKAYDAARGQGLIEARGRAGSFVIDRVGTPPADSAPVDTGMNMPPEIANGSLATAWERGTAALLRGPGAAARLHYQPAGGTAQDRAIGVRLLAGRGIASVEEQVIVTAGGQNALHAIVAATLRPGDAVVCGRYVYPGFLGLALRYGLRLVPLPRIDAASIAAACATTAIRALYVVPTNDNPTAATIEPEERCAIAALADRHGFQIIEDDAYGPLADRPLVTFAELAPDRCWHIASLSKIISPALRIAHVRAPSVRDALRLAADCHETSVMAPPLNAALVSLWVQDGSFVRLVAETRAEAAWRRSLARDILANFDHAAHPQGYHLWLPLPPGIAAANLVNLVRPQGLSVVASSSFAVAPDAPQALRVSLGGIIDRNRLGRTLRVLEAHLASVTGRGSPLV